MPLPPFSPPPVFTPGICQMPVSPIQDGFNPVSNVSLSSWAVLTRTVSTTAGSAWKIKAYGISNTVASAFNTRLKVRVFPYFESWGIVKPVVYPIDYRMYIPAFDWAVDGRKSVTQRSSWKLIQRRSSLKPVKFNVLVKIYAIKPTVQFKVYQRLRIPGTALEEFNSGLVQPIVHPVDFGPSLPAHQSTWNLNKRQTPRITSRFELDVRKSAQVRSTFNDNGLLVTATVASSWMYFGKVTDKAQVSWNLVGRKNKKIRSTFFLKSAVVDQKSIHFRVFNKVTDQAAITWNLIRRPSAMRKSTWNTLARRTTSVIRSTFYVRLQVIDRPWRLISNSAGNISTSVVHPIDYRAPGLIRIPNYGLGQPVVYPIDYGNTVYPGYGSFPIPESMFRVGINPNGRVVTQSATTFNTMIKVKDTSRITWNMVGRTAKAQLSQYNILIGVKTQTPSCTFNVGKPIAGHIKQMSIDRTDFTY